MERSTFWKNFKLREEVEISGIFIYNGLKAFHDMVNFDKEEEIFEVLYNISVGIERLFKVAIVLIKHDESVDQEEFEDKLITHSHLKLFGILKEECEFNFGKPHNEFLSLLTKFYKSHRYDRFGLSGTEAVGKEKARFQNYLDKHLDTEIKDRPEPFPFPNDKDIKKSFGKIVGKICKELYSIIENQARELNIFTYELSYESKAAKIFLREEYNFKKEEVLWKELLVFLLNTEDSSERFELIRDQEPLDFDIGLLVEYLKSFSSSRHKLRCIDELDELYKQLDNPGQRLKKLDLFDNSNVIFDPPPEAE